MSAGVTELLNGRWAVPLVGAAAFLLPLLLADRVRSEPTRRLAYVTVAPAVRAAADTSELSRIPDLRPARALPRLQTARPGDVAPAPASAPAPAAARAATTTTTAAPAASAPARRPAARTAPSAGSGSGGAPSGGSGSFENSGSSSGEFQSSD